MSPGRVKVWMTLGDGCNVSTDESLKLKVKVSYEKIEISSTAQVTNRLSSGTASSDIVLDPSI
jgi:hypothetical protein